ncbi:MAG: helix-turn-helix domain-containing protein [Syntrophales bacterium LBB04]|nr:helix-turn-helix domain-containing protein [Syntrophales bacterium LBB04]
MKTGDEICLKSLGQYLRKERESRQISLQEFSRKMGMGSCFISALEENNFDFFSEPRFIFCFLERYALQLGLDPKEVLRRFAAQYELDLQKKSYLKNHSDTFRSWEEHKRFRGGLIFGAIFILILFFSGFLFLNKPSKPGSLAILAPKAKEFQKGVLIPTILPLSSRTGAKGISVETRESSERASSKKLHKKNPANGAEDYSEGVLSSALGRVKVVGNRDSKRYHLPGMKYYYKVEAYHRVEFDSEEEAIRAGYHKAPK